MSDVVQFLSGRWGITIGMFLLLLLLRGLKRYVERYSQARTIDTARTTYIRKTLNFFWFLVFLIGLTLTWKLRFQNLSWFFASFFTVAGIALFATWSILSNVTATLILFFHHPLRIGNFVKIIDGDNTVSGHVKDITLFSIVIINDEGQEVTYPNNLALQKPIVVDNRTHQKTRKIHNKMENEEGW